jgi:Raf kinase inhibitor-like YbhB/YbcL family protein
MATTEMDLADVNASIAVSSTAFGDEQRIPARYTSEGEGLSPPLEWSGVPMNAEAVVVLIEDVESSAVHAIAWDLPGSDTALPEGALPCTCDSGKAPTATYVPLNPPAGRGPHRYAFQVFALDTVPRFDSRPGRAELLDKIKGHVLAKGVLIGACERRTRAEL